MDKDWAKGSPPPVRGKGAESVEYVLDDRITPACAGKSDIRAMIEDVFEDHPRLCGEKPAGATG